MTENEVGVFLKELGCRFGVNLDGGGSSIMLIPDEAGDLTTVNMPSDGTPRPVPVLFGVAPAGNLDRKKED
jgi:exopolysaccharide biosynthesis protein